jgi:translin
LALSEELSAIVEQIRQSLDAKNRARDLALQRSRTLVRLCAHAIRATHREEWPEALVLMEQARLEADALVTDLQPFPDLYYSGYAQDALKEFVEANLTYAVIRDQPLPSLAALRVEPATFLGGLSEAATELRRRILDIVRQQHDSEAERLLEAMDAVYDELITVDFPDAITDGLRRRTDVLRGVLERTRGDVTNSLRQHGLQSALRDVERRLCQPDHGLEGRGSDNTAAWGDQTSEVGPIICGPAD